MQPTAQDIQKQQGTRLNEAAPWQTYAAEMGQNLSPELAAEVAQYAQSRYADTKPSSQSSEELARLREGNEEVAREYQWATPDEYQNVEERTGKVMRHDEFITLLRKAGVSCWYTTHVHADKLVLLTARDGGPREVAAWVAFGFMPELSILNFDDKGAPLAERRRGWRTVLLQLILKGVISEDKANKIFGKPKLTASFARYNSTLQAFRNAGSSLDE